MLREGVNFEAILDRVSDGVIVAGPDRRVVHWNAGAERLVGCGREEAMGALAGELLVLFDGEGRLLPPEACPLERAMADGCAHTAECVLRRKEGDRARVSVWAGPLRDGAGATLGIAAVISETPPDEALAERVAELERQAFVDPLTGLPNRRYAAKRLADRLGEWHRYGWPFAVLMADIDRFKPVNDAFGHAAGDAVLKTVGRVLKENLRFFDLVARWGGDEFVVLVVNVDGPQMGALADRLRQRVKEAETLAEGGRRIQVTVSVGAAEVRKEDTAKSIAERADAMLYKSKEEGRDRVSLAE